MNIGKDVYLNLVLEQTPRLLGLINRNIGSPAYGCFDREYWHYNTTDFPCAEHQESVLTLAYLYLIQAPSNPFFNNPLLIEWINAGIHFWRRIQNPNGSFSEWYPHENSMSTTPFSVYAISETLLLLDRHIGGRPAVIASLEKAGSWLMQHHDFQATNHFCGSTVALFNLFLLTGKRHYADAARRIAASLGRYQTIEGWFREYKGADIGYTSVALYYLANYYLKSKDEQVLPVISRALEFTSYFLHPDGSFGGDYGSRNTAYLIPHGFEIIASFIPSAAVIAREIRASTQRNSHVSLNALDDRYLCYLSYMYIQSYRDAQATLPENIPPRHRSVFSRYFDQAGLSVNSTAKYYLVISGRKGGAFKIDFKDSGHSFMDSGILMMDTRGRWFYSFYFQEDEVMDIRDGVFKTSRPLAGMTMKTLTPATGILQRLFLMTLGRFETIDSMVKSLLRKALITRNRLSPIRFSRQVTLSDDHFTVRDWISPLDSIQVLYVGVNSSYIYGPSTRFFQKSFLNLPVTMITRDQILQMADQGQVVITRTFNAKGERIALNITAS